MQKELSSFWRQTATPQDLPALDKKEESCFALFIETTLNATLDEIKADLQDFCKSRMKI